MGSKVCELAYVHIGLLTSLEQETKAKLGKQVCAAMARAVNVITPSHRSLRPSGAAWAARSSRGRRRERYTHDGVPCDTKIADTDPT